MTYLQFKTAVYTHLDVDGTRRGIQPLRDAVMKSAIADLKYYIPDYRDNTVAYADATIIPFDDADEAVAEFIKSRITRSIDKDLALSQAHKAEFLNLRRRLHLTHHESPTKIELVAGRSLAVPLLFNRDISNAFEIYFTVMDAGGVTPALQCLLSTGTIQVDPDNNRLAIATLLPAATAALVGLYVWDATVNFDQDDVMTTLGGLLSATKGVTIL